MAKNTSFALGEHFEVFVQQQVASGRYATASEVVREALRGMEARQKLVADFDAALTKGTEELEHGQGVPHDAVWDALEGKQ